MMEILAAHPYHAIVLFVVIGFSIHQTLAIVRARLKEEELAAEEVVETANSSRLYAWNYAISLGEAKSTRDILEAFLEQGRGELWRGEGKALLERHILAHRKYLEVVYHHADADEYYQALVRKSHAYGDPRTLPPYPYGNDR